MKFLALVGYIFLLATVLTLGACDYGFRMSAQVVDSEGTAIAGANVSASRDKLPPEFKATTDKSGCLSLGGLTGPDNSDYQIVISAPGYRAFQMSEPVLQPKRLRIVLPKRSQVFTGQAIATTEQYWHEHCGGI